MTKQNIRIIAGVFILFAGYYFLTFLCEVGIKCKECNRYSMTIAESKEKNLYVAKYRPLEKKIKLKYHQDSVEFTEAWAESAWFINSDNCLFKKVEKSKGFNFIIEFESNPSDPENFLIYGNGFDLARTHKRKSGKIFELKDTLTFHTFEKNPDSKIGWRNEIAGEDIQFVRIRM